MGQNGIRGGKNTNRDRNGTNKKILRKRKESVRWNGREREKDNKKVKIKRKLREEEMKTK